MPTARSSSRLLAALLALALGLVALAGPATPASAQATPTDPPPVVDPRRGPDDRIVGGTEAPAGAWPSVVAIMYTYPGEDYTELQCGGTLIDPSWVLTAAHCVSDGPGYPISTRNLRVRIGTQDLAQGGSDVRIARVVVRPSFSYDGIRDDVALIQLARPVGTARPLQVASPTDIPWSGANLTVAGWGQSEDPRQFTVDRLRQVDVPAMSGAECRAELDAANAEYGSPPYHTSHLCTGPLGSGGRGHCYGDSGGPLVWEKGGRQIIVGISSWVVTGCASPETPSVFSKVASASRWIAQTIQYGPHIDPRGFAFATTLAYLGYDPRQGPFDLPPPGEPGAHIVAQHGRTGVTQRDATIVRLYDSILGRPADHWGYQYWRERMFYGRFEGSSTYGPTRVAEVMARSAEFTAEYGSLDDQSFVEQLYLNVLDRAGAPADVAYWVGRLTGGDSRGKVAALITESAENRARTQSVVDVQVAFMNLIQRAPAAYEIAQWQGQPLADLGRFLVHSVAYARMWGGIYWE